MIRYNVYVNVKVVVYDEIAFNGTVYCDTNIVVNGNVTMIVFRYRVMAKLRSVRSCVRINHHSINRRNYHDPGLSVIAGTFCTLVHALDTARLFLHIVCFT